MSSSAALKNTNEGPRRSSSALTHTSTIHTAIAETAGIFPGAFNDSIILGACTNASLFKEVQREEAVRAITLLRPAIEDTPMIGAPAHLQLLSYAAFNAIAIQDPTGTKVRMLEDILITLNVGSSLKLNEAQQQEQLLQLNTTVNLLADESHWPSVPLTPLLGPDFPYSELIQKNQPGTIKFTEAITNPTCSSLSSEIDILQATARLAIKSHLIARCYQYNLLNRKILQSEVALLEKECTELTQLCKDYVTIRSSVEAAELESIQQSAGLRTIRLVKGLTRLQNQFDDIAELMSKAYKENPFNGPKVLLLAGLGRLFTNTPSGQKAETPFSPADEEMCEKTTFLLMLDKGRLNFSHIRYDYQWGKLCTNSQVDIPREFGRGFIPAPDKYEYVYLARIVSMFPAINFSEIDSHLRELRTNENFKLYLNEKNRRYGPRLVPDKSWLKGKGRNEEFISFLAYITDLLKDKDEQSPLLTEKPSDVKTQLIIHDKPEIKFQQWSEEFRRIFANSMLCNSQGEQFLFEYLKLALWSGSSLGDFRLKKYGSQLAYNWLCRLEESECLLSVSLVFDLQDKEAEKKGVRLTDFGYNYLINLIDPSFKQHQKGDDCIELQELKAKRDYGRYG